MKKELIGKVSIALIAPSAGFSMGWWWTPVKDEIIGQQQMVAEIIVESEVEDGLAAIAPQLAELDALANDDWPDDAAMKLAELAESDPARAGQMVQRLSLSEQVHPTYAVAAFWASSDPEAAIAWIDSLPESDLASKSRRLALCVWSDVAPGAALNYFHELEATEKRAFVDMIFDWELTRSLDRAIDRESGYTNERITCAEVFLRNIPASQQDEILGLMESSKLETTQWAAKRARASMLVDLHPDDPAAAIFAAKELRAEGAALARIAVKDPLAALALAEETDCRPGIIIHLWAKRDPEAALAAIPRISDYNHRLLAMTSWRNVLLNSDPQRVVESFAGEKLEQSSVHQDSNVKLTLSRRENLRRKAIEKWFWRDPLAATKGAATTLVDENDRKRVIALLQTVWHKHEPGKARQRLIQSGFREEEIPIVSSGRK